MAAAKKFLNPRDVPKEYREYLDFSKQEIKNEALAILTHCPICSKESWKSVSKMRHRKASPYCCSCLRCSFLGPSDVSPEYVNYYDFSSQRPSPTRQLGGLCILVICPNCKLQRWQKVTKVRTHYRTPYCNQCTHLRYLQLDETPKQFLGYLYFNCQKMLGPTIHIKGICPICQEENWISVCNIRNGYRQSPVCNSCNTIERNKANAKGRYLVKQEYVNLTISHLSPKDRILAYAMVNTKSAISEHRLVMARHLGRPLESNEHVHHRNSKRDDNRLANLRLVTLSTHNKAPADKIAKLATEIEAKARTLKTMQIDVTSYLEKYIAELGALIPPRLL